MEEKKIQQEPEKKKEYKPPDLTPKQDDDPTSQEEIENMTEKDAKETVLDAARYGDCDTDLQNILNNKKWTSICKDCVDDQGRTPLHMACANGHASTFHVLMQHKPHLDQANESGYTALHYAAMNGHLYCVKTLIEAGIDMSLKNKFGKTALDECWGNGHDDVENVLLANDKEISEMVSTEATEEMSAGETIPSEPESGESQQETSSSSSTVENNKEAPKTETGEEHEGKDDDGEAKEILAVE